MEFTKVNSGAFKLCFGGFTYTKKAEKKNRIRWECSKGRPNSAKEPWRQARRSAILADSYDGGEMSLGGGGIVRVGNCPGGLSRGEMSYTPSLNGFFSYLQHRSQRVRICTNQLSYSQLNGAMPQGSWLRVRPLLFLVLISDIKPDCLVHKYVDDTTLTELLYDRTKPFNMQSFFLNWSIWLIRIICC